MAHLAQQNQWTKVCHLMLGEVVSANGMMKYISKPILGIGARLMAMSAPEDPTDFIVTIEAEDQFNFKDQLKHITVPTLVVAGADDPFYTEELFRETAVNIPHAKLILYDGVGHPATGKQFEQDVLAFLKEPLPKSYAV